jgi:hypothetical protein
LKRINQLSILAVFIAGTVLSLLALTPTRTAKADAPSACASLTAESFHSDACNAEIAANPKPDLVRPTVFNAETDGASQPRSVLLPEEGTPYPLGWMIKAWYWSDQPGVLPPDWGTQRIIQKAELVWIYQTLVIAGKEWLLIGPDRWMPGEHVAVLKIPARPVEVNTVQWIALDLAEQTLVAFEGDMPIFATLISAGYWDYGITREGIFQVYARAEHTTFRGPPWANPPKYVYNFVPHAIFFDGNVALHGAYWHDWFGFARSHGCVNVPVADEAWIWNWMNETEDEWGPQVNTFRLPNPEKAPWVYVYVSSDTAAPRN